MGYEPISRLDTRDQQILRLLAYFPTDDDLPVLAGKVPGAVQAGRLREIVNGTPNRPGLFDRLVTSELDVFCQFVRAHGLDGDVYRSMMHDYSKKRELLGALWLMHRASERHDSVALTPALDEVARADLAERLFLPVALFDVVTLRADGWRWRSPFDHDVPCRLTDPKVRTPQERAFIDRVWEQVKVANRGATDTPTHFSVVDYSYRRDDDTALLGVELLLAPTNYREFQGTNNVLQVDDGRFAREAWRLGFVRSDIGNPYDLPASELSNNLSVTCVAFARDRHNVEWMGIQRRNRKKVASGKYWFQATAGGFTTIAENKRDESDDNGVPDPFQTICREFAEEAYVLEGGRSPVLPTDVTLFALARDLASCLEVGLVGEINLRQPYEDVILMLPGVDHWFEGQPKIDPITGLPVSPIQWVRADPEHFASWLKREAEDAEADDRKGIAAFMPFGLTAIVLALVRRYGQERVLQALKPIVERYGRHNWMTRDQHRPPTPDPLCRTAWFPFKS